MSVETIKRRDGKVIIKANSDLINTERAEELQKAIENVLKAGEKELVLDLVSIEAINRYGIGKILTHYNELKKAGGELYLYSPLPPMIKKAFDSMWLTKMFKEYKH